MPVFWNSKSCRYEFQELSLSLARVNSERIQYRSVKGLNPNTWWIFRRFDAVMALAFGGLFQNLTLHYAWIGTFSTFGI